MTPIEQVFDIFKDFFQLIINLCRTNTNKFHPRYFKFAFGQFSAIASINDLNIRWLFVVKVTNQVVWTCKFVKTISRTYSITGLNDFFHSVAFSCSKRFRYSVQNLTKFKLRILAGPHSVWTIKLTNSATETNK